MKKLNPIEVCLQACENWGLIPTSFRQCMTWEEQVLWLSKFLEKTVIPALNDDIAAITELQGLFIELKEYVDNYFDNLDVQDEVNNKLDEMAESGQLADIIAAYLQLKGVLAFDTVADIEDATNLVNGSFVKTYGYLRTGDGVYDIYKVREMTNVDVIDGYNLVAITAAPTLVAERLDYGKELVIKLKSTDNLQSYLSLDGKKTIVLPANTSMTFSDALLINSDTTIDLNGSTIVFDYVRSQIYTYDWDETLGFMSYAPDSTFTVYNGNKNITIKNGKIAKGSSCFMHSQNVLFDNVEFTLAGSRHMIQLAACKNFTVKNCTFNGTQIVDGAANGSECVNIDPCNYGAQPFINESSPMFDHTKNMNVLFENNIFNQADTITSQYFSAIGSHGGDDSNQLICENLTIVNNIFGTPVRSAINLRDANKIYITGNTMKNADSGYFICKFGSVNGVDVANNIVYNTYGFWNNNSPSNISSNIVISNNQITCLDPNQDANGVLQLINVHDATVDSNTITYQHHAFHLNDKSYFDGGTDDPANYSENVVISNNTLKKTQNQAVWFDFRIAKTLNLKITNNSFNYKDVTINNQFYSLNIQTGTTIAEVSGNTTDSPSNFQNPTTITNKYRNNYAYYLNSGGMNATSVTDNFLTDITKFRKLILIIGSGSNTQTIQLLPWLLNGDKLDTRTYKFASSNDSGNFVSGTFQIVDSTTFTYTCNVPIRMIYCQD